MHPATTLTDEQFRALADPVRRRILVMVNGEEHAAGRISGHFQITRPAVSRHLKVLRQAQLVTVRHVGTTRYYAADRTALRDLGHWFGHFWDDGLARLKALAEAEAKHGDR